MKMYIKKLIAFGVDLFFAGLLLLAFFKLYYADRTTFAERGMPINSPEVIAEQTQIVLVVPVLWFVYIIATSLTLKKTLGYQLLGAHLQNENDNFLKRTIFFLFGPIPTLDKLLHYKIDYSAKLNWLRVSIGALLTMMTLPAFFLYIFLAGFIFLAPRTDIQTGTSFESITMAVPRTNCKREIRSIRNHTVEVLGETKAGSGLLIDHNLVLTNYHVVEGEPSIQIRESNGRLTDAHVQFFSEEYDSAVLVGDFSTYTFVEFVDPEQLEVGTTTLYAIGYPGSLIRDASESTVSVSQGIYSSLLKFDDSLNLHLVQTDAAVNSGNSGGPLVNDCGQVAGIVTLTEKWDEQLSIPKEGLNFAVSTGTIIPSINQALK